PPGYSPPPPGYSPPPPVYAPPPPVAPPYVAPPTNYGLMGRVFTGVGITLLVVGFLALFAGIPVTVLTYTETLCKPSTSQWWGGSSPLAPGLPGGGAALRLSGLALPIVGRVSRARAGGGSIASHAPRLALVPPPAGGVSGAAAALDFTF